MQLKRKSLQKEETELLSIKIFLKKRLSVGQIGLLDKECYRLQGQMGKLERNREERLLYVVKYELLPIYRFLQKRERNLLIFRRYEATGSSD